MLRMTGAALAALMTLSATGALAQGASAEKAPVPAGTSDRQEAQKVFAQWTKPDSPGCALEAVRDGKPLITQGFGFADIEHDAAITPATVFHVASVSKQFTAFAIHLLAHDGKLSLDDDIRKHLPELHDFGKTITIRHLIHHTSGIRDQWDMLFMAGWRPDDVITEQDILDMVWRQKELNFAPGEEHLYSNSGYTLLGVIVKRVSGKSLREFADERMFKPLGMQHTHFHDDYSFLVKNRANSYGPQPSGGRYRYVALSYSNVGATSLFTTVGDLARWDENFYTGAVGGKELIAQMQVKGKLNNGQEIPYASGISTREYRGLRVVEHSGGDAAFRSHFMRFPEQHFSAIVLCNAGDAPTTRLAQQVADIYLKAELKPAPESSTTSADAAKPVEVKIDPKLLDAYVGEYMLPPNTIVSFMRNGDQLMTQAPGQPPFQVFPSSETSFFPKQFEAQITFERPAADGKSAGFKLRQGGRDLSATRMERARPTPERLNAYAGTFFSGELNALYFVSARDGKLFVRHPRGEIEVSPTTADSFAAPWPVGMLKYNCDSSNRCDSFAIGSGRVRSLRLERVDLSPRASPR
jgi:CubicO group peptidase (beta-lactamase class C family)